jgi:exopolyphosphatase/guanosine-5'-triphosphate,3'-diphosphate pyrophosphatase
VSEPVAAIDCGTNSIRLLVATVNDQGQLVDLDRRMVVIRLGEGVDKTGMISPAALDRAFAACDEFAAVVARLGARNVRFVATSASRDASNRQDFVDGVKARIGVEPEVISGHEEAALSFAGATQGLHPLPASPYIVVDIGGGSTEFVLGTDQPEASMSVDMGCVRLTERLLVSDPPTQEEIDQASKFVDSLIARARTEVDWTGAATLIGLAGSVTTVAAIALGLDEYDSERIHGSRISAEQVHDVTSRLLAMTRSERVELGVMHPGRVDVIGGGALVLDRIMHAMQMREVLVSEHDILDGIALSLL